MMINLPRPIVLVHGLWDRPNLFSKFISSLDLQQDQIFVPYLPHDLGKISIKDLADDLDSQIKRRFGQTLLIDILGFSMGGLVSRVWLQDLKGIRRTKNFYSVGSPQQGTLTAQLIPGFLFAGISDMKIGSYLINRLNNQSEKLQNLNCISFYSNWDLMVFPGWRAKLPYGKSFSLPVLTHKSLITDPKSINFLINILVNA